MENIYDLNLHEETTLINTSCLELTVTRVPGGWIYEHMYYSESGVLSSSSVFVPYNNEFKELRCKKIE